MTVARVLQNSFAVIALTTCLAAAQTSVPSIAFRQPLDDAWWTGPLLAPNASTLPQGRVLVEPYLYDVITEGFYNSAGTRISAPHENGYGSLTYVNYGLVNKFTVGAIPTFSYNEPGKGPGSGGGDLMVQAQYRLHLFHEGGWLPTTSTQSYGGFRYSSDAVSAWHRTSIALACRVSIPRPLACSARKASISIP